MTELMQLAQIACDEAVGAGAEWADAAASRERAVGVEVEKNGIHTVQERRTTGLSVRAIIRGARAFATTSRNDPGSAREAARRAVEAARLAVPDPDFVALPEPGTAPEVAALWDQRIVTLNAEDLIGVAIPEVDAARSVNGDLLVEASAHASANENVLVTSRGIETSLRRTTMDMRISCVIRRGDDVGSFHDYAIGRNLDDFAPQGLGMSVAGQAVKGLGSRSMRAGVTTLVCGPLSAQGVFGSLAIAASAEHIQRQRSYLVGKRGQRIAPESLTLTDEPFIPGGGGSGPYDEEGAPRQRVVMIERGVLVNWLHGSYTANKAGEPNNGHGTRSGGVSPTNVLPALGEHTAAELIRDTRDGIYMSRGSMWPDLASGEVSATVDSGWKIEGGEFAYPLTNTMVGIGVFELLNNLDAISSDYRLETGIVMPTIRIRDVRVSGSA